MRLKSVLNALLLTFGLAAVSYAGVYDYNPSQASNGNYASQGQYSYIHNAFYFEASLGLQYLNISDEKKTKKKSSMDPVGISMKLIFPVWVLNFMLGLAE